MLKIPYGISDYKVLKEENYYYVDKTMYLENLENSGKTLVFLRPRRFGKTLFTSMMYYYYDINSKDKFDTLFKDTYVYDNPTKNKNNYYILKLDFSGMNASNDEELEYIFTKKVIDSIRRFNIDYNVNIKTEYDKCYAPGVLSDFIEDFRELRLENKLYIIIDEYDNFTNSILKGSGDTFKKALGNEGFIKSFYARIKEYSGQGIIDRVFITGVCSITLDSMTSGFNISQNITNDKKFNSMMGLTYNEVNELLNDIENKENIFEILKDNYDGYLFSEDSNDKIFNSTLVMYFLKYYYENNEIPRNLLDSNIISNYEQLGNIIKLQDNYFYKDIIDKILKEKEILGELKVNFSLDLKLNKDDIISMLYYFGYLTIKERNIYTNSLIFKVPNNIINIVYNDYFISMLNEINIILDDNSMNDSIKEMVENGKIDKISNYVSEILKLSDNRIFMKFDEKYVQNIYFTLLCKNNLFKVYNEYPCSNGYIDLMLIKNNERCKCNIMIELKYIKKRDYSKNYFNKIKNEGIEQLNSYSKDERIDENTKKYLVIFVGNKIKFLEEI